MLKWLLCVIILTANLWNECVVSYKLTMMEPSIIADAELLPVTVDRTSQKRSKSAEPILCRMLKPISQYTREELVPKVSDNRSQENITNYEPGGFMCVELGQTVGAYKIVRKIGHGAFSTVWLGVDVSGRFAYRKFVAIKIGKASKRGYDSIKKEMVIMRRLRSRDTEHTGYNFIMKFCHDMLLQSSTGMHAALVMQPVGRSLFELFQEAAGRGVNIEAGRKIARQLLLGLTYLHDVCKMIHTDLKPGNVIITVSDQYLNDMIEKVNRYEELDHLVPRSYVSTVDYVERENLARLRSTDEIIGPAPTSRRRSTTSKPRNFSNPMLLPSNIEVKISDMGHVVDRQPINRGIIQTPLYRSLEVYLTEQYDYSADVWSFGCLIFELMTGELLFSPTTHRLGANEHVVLIFKILKGAIPMHIRRRGMNASKYFYPDGCLKRLELVDKMESPRDILVDYMGWPEPHAEIFGNLISSCLNPDPNTRPTAAMVLKHKWFKHTKWFQTQRPTPIRKPARKIYRSHSI